MKTSLSSLGLLRLGVVSPELRVADVHFNTQKIIEAIDEAANSDCQLLLFPELCITGYSCADLFYQSLLLKEAEKALWQIASHTQKTIPVVVGSPLCVDGRLFNCAVLAAAGSIVGAIPKTFMPNTCEFYEKRWFSTAPEFAPPEIYLKEVRIPFGANLLFRCTTLPGCIVGIEICEDLWAANPPSGYMAAAGATLLLNPSASHEFLGKAEYRRMLVQSQSARCLAAYAYASSGPGESTTDLVFSGHCMIAENGTLLAQTERFQFSTQIAMSDVDIERLINDRIRNDTFAHSSPLIAFRLVDFPGKDVKADRLLRPVIAFPFVPAESEERSQRCKEIFAIQTTALAKRLRHTGISSAVLGISGGLDSTLALLVAAKAFDKLHLNRKNIWAIIMPGFGTGLRTSSNAEKLAEMLGVSLKKIPIAAAVQQHFADIGHDQAKQDVTYENAQARERTQILMDIANDVHGLMIGTGDLSELALGWCTYNGDHMAMYGVNAGIPKTLVRYLLQWCAACEFSGETAKTLEDICATPPSPELLPPDREGHIQATEDKIGPYLLHDFFLYHVVRLHFRPHKVFFLASLAFAGQYKKDEILHWLKVFYSRFFSQQFKRSCLPDGPKVGTLALSPRGDWRMPSDASASLWMEELHEIEDQLSKEQHSLA